MKSRVLFAVILSVMFCVGEMRPPKPVPANLYCGTSGCNREDSKITSRNWAFVCQKMPETRKIAEPKQGEDCPTH